MHILGIISGAAQKRGQPQLRRAPRVPEGHVLAYSLCAAMDLRRSARCPRTAYLFSAVANVIRKDISKANYSLKREAVVAAGRALRGQRRRRPWRPRLKGDHGHVVEDRAALQTTASD